MEYLGGTISSPFTPKKEGGGNKKVLQFFLSLKFPKSRFGLAFREKHLRYAFQNWLM